MRNITPLAMVAALGLSAVYFQMRSNSLAQAAKSSPAIEAPAAAAAPTPAAEATPPVAPETPAPVKPQPWPQETSDIPADPDATFGSLSNGFRYIIYPNSEPPGRVSLRLHIDAGSLMEADDQQGIAHFLEHMVFNGSKHYKPDELIPVMQRLGIGFGAHVNAYTSFDQTVYMLDLPEVSQEILDLGFNILRDFGDGALFPEEEIDHERGVILSEKVSRDSVESRIQEQQFAELLPGSLIANRFPIGKEDIIAKAPRDRFLDFYHRYYIPSRMTFVVVGNIDPKAMEQRIKASFDSMQNPSNPGTDPDLGPVVQPEGVEPAVFTDKEFPSTELSIVAIRKFTDEPDTSETRIKHMPLDVAHAMLSRRFDRIAKKENSPILGGSASRQDIFRHSELGSVDVSVSDSRWLEAIPVLEQEFRRAVEHGFSAAELAEAKANLTNAYEQQVKTKSTRRSERIASAIAGSIPDRTVFSSPETDLEIAKKGLEALTPEACHTALKDFWNDVGLRLILTTKEASESAKSDLSAAYQESKGVPVESHTATEIAAFGYTTFGPAGKVTTTKTVDDLGITQLVLSNNVRVNLKRTDFEKNSIRILARIGSGQLSQPADKPGLSMVANAIFAGGGLGKHSVDDLEQILAGRNVGVALRVGEDAFTLSGRSTPEDFALQAQLACASITDPGYRDEALWQFRKMLPALEQNLKHSPAGPQTEMESWLRGNDPRFTMPSTEKLGTYTIEDVKKWVSGDLQKGYLELSIVGDFEQDAVIPVLNETFGALPKRAATKPALDAQRKLKLPVAPATKVFTFESKIPTAIALAFWKTDGVRGHTPEVRRLNILAEIYGDRLREEIREKLGASYSPSAEASGSDALEKFGFILGEATAKPEDVEHLGTVMRDLADELSKTGATEDQLERAKKPILASLQNSARSNTYWLNALSQSQEDPTRLKHTRERDADYASITLQEVNALAKKYLGASNLLSIGIKPKE